MTAAPGDTALTTSSTATAPCIAQAHRRRRCARCSPICDQTRADREAPEGLRSRGGGVSTPISDHREVASGQRSHSVHLIYKGRLLDLTDVHERHEIETRHAQLLAEHGMSHLDMHESQHAGGSSRRRSPPTPTTTSTWRPSASLQAATVTPASPSSRTARSLRRQDRRSR